MNNSLNGLQKKKENKKDFFVPTFLQTKQEEVANEKVKKTTFFWQRKFIDSHLPSPKKKNALLFFFCNKVHFNGPAKKNFGVNKVPTKGFFFSPQQHTYLSKKRKQHSLKNTKWVIWVRKAKPCNINWGENKSLFFLDLLVKRRINRCCSFFFLRQISFFFPVFFGFERGHTHLPCSFWN